MSRYVISDRRVVVVDDPAKLIARAQRYEAELAPALGLKAWVPTTIEEALVVLHDVHAGFEYPGDEWGLLDCLPAAVEVDPLPDRPVTAHEKAAQADEDQP